MRGVGERSPTTHPRRGAGTGICLARGSAGLEMTRAVAFSLLAPARSIKGKLAAVVMACGREKRAKILVLFDLLSSTVSH